MLATGRPLLAAGLAYPATVSRVECGDTVRLDVDCGLERLGARVWLHDVRVAIAGAAARPLHDPGGMQARNHLAYLLPVGQPVTVWPLLVGEGLVFGRVRAFGADLAEQLVLDGWAAAWHGRGRKPIPPWPRPDEEL